MEYHRLPDGSTTKSERKYVAEWRRLGKQACKALGPGWQMYGFDPTLALQHRDGRKLECPVWLAVQLHSLASNS